MIGHNCMVGENCMLCGQGGIAGSCTVGDRVVLAGQVGVADHVAIGSDVVVGGGSGVAKDIPAKSVYLGYPAMPKARAAEQLLNLNRLRSVFRSEEHASELQSLMRISYAVFCLKKKKTDYLWRHSRTHHNKN